MDTPTPLQMLEDIVSMVNKSYEQANAAGTAIPMVIHPDSIVMRQAQRVIDAHTEDDKIIMSPDELANYVEGYLKDLAGDYPEEAIKIFEQIFTTATVVAEDGTFTVDMDGKTS